MLLDTQGNEEALAISIMAMTHYSSTILVVVPESKSSRLFPVVGGCIFLRDYVGTGLVLDR